MSMAYHSLEHSTLDGNVHYARPVQVLPERVTAQNPALDVMTDLRRTIAATTTPHRTIDHALQDMINLGVRMLLVEGHNELINGLITATDIQGDKPMRIIQDTGQRRDEIEVRDIMIPLSQIEAMKLANVEHSLVGDIVTTMTQAGRQHALVVDNRQGKTVIVGIFSTTQVSRQLGIEVNPTEKPQTFTELEMAITG